MGEWEIRAEAAQDTSTGTNNQVLRHVCAERGVVYRGDTRPISVLGSSSWRDTSVRLRFKLEDAQTQGFVVSLRMCNHAMPTWKDHDPNLSCRQKPDDRNQVLPQATNVNGVYVVLKMDGAVQLANSTLGVDSAVTHANVAPLRLHRWYNLSVAMSNQRLSWSLVGSAGVPTAVSGTIEVPVASFPVQGQIGLGLVDYGTASIDDLVVEDIE